MTSTTTPLNGNRLIFFSPTRTSAQIARAIGEGIGMGRRMETDLTLDESSSPIELERELCVIVTPVYGGRVPVLALQRLQRLKGNGALRFSGLYMATGIMKTLCWNSGIQPSAWAFHLLLPEPLLENTVTARPNCPSPPDVRIRTTCCEPANLGKPAWRNGTTCTQPVLRFPN